MLKDALSAFYLLEGGIDFNPTCTDVSLGDSKELIRTW